MDDPTRTETLSAEVLVLKMLVAEFIARSDDRGARAMDAMVDGMLREAPAPSQPRDVAVLDAIRNMRAFIAERRRTIGQGGP